MCTYRTATCVERSIHWSDQDYKVAQENMELIIYNTDGIQYPLDVKQATRKMIQHGFVSEEQRLL